MYDMYVDDDFGCYGRDRGQLWPYPRVSCDPTRSRGQLRPYPQEFYGKNNVFWPYQGSAVTLPDLSVKNSTGFYTISRFMLSMIQGPSTTFLLSPTTFYHNFPPPRWQPMLFIKNLTLSKFSLPLCSPRFQLQHSFYQKAFLKFQNSPPLCSPCFQLQHSFYQKPYFYQNFPPPLQPMLSTTTFLLSKTFLFIKIFPPFCSPCFQLHSFYQKHSFHHKFPHPLQSMLSIIQVTRGHLRPYLTSCYQNLSTPLCGPCFQLQHSFYQKHSFYQIFPFFCSPCFQLHSFYQKHSFYQNFPPPSAAHACNDSGYQGSSATPPDFLL